MNYKEIDKETANEEETCDTCYHNTYTPGYYTDRSLFCFHCSLYKSSNKYSQWSKKEEK